MPPDASPKELRCHNCRARLKIGDDRCWLCAATVPANADATEMVEPSAAPPMPTATDGRAASFSMATLMMFVTLVAIVCGVFSIAPGVGAALALVLLPVLTHTAIAARREETMGHSLRPGEQIMLFFSSMGLVVVAGVAASIAFGITCFGGFFGGAALGEVMGAKGYEPLGWGAVTGIGIGAIAGAFVGYRALMALSRNSAWRREGMPSLSRGSKIALIITFLVALIGVVLVIGSGM